MHSRRSTKWSAWSSSIALHAALLLTLAWLVSSSTAPSASEPDRPVGIVLVERDAGGESEYLSESPPAPNSAQAPALPGEEAAQQVLEGFGRPTQLDGLTAQGAAGQGVVQTAHARAAPQAVRLPGRGDADVLADDSIRNAPSAATGPTAVLAPFGMAAEGRSFVFLLDRSQSMGRLGALAAAEKELIRVLAALEPAHRFQIIAYNEDLSYLQPRKMATATEENKERAARFLRGLVASRGTRHETALLAALRQNADIVYLLSDAEDPPLTVAQIRRIAAQAAGRTAIHSIHFGVGPAAEATNFTAILARQTGGEYGYVDLAK
jgi:hypothetical protein